MKRWQKIALIVGVLVGALVALFVGAVVVVAALGAVGVIDLPEPPPEGDSAAGRQGNGARHGRRRERGPTVRVIRVIDGDTVVATRIGETRLIGVDTPEQGRCYQNEATRFTRRRLLDERVGYELGVEREDRYGRTLAYLSRGNEMHNLELIEEGYARVLTIRPNDKYAPRFLAAEQEAKRRTEGRWSGTCEKRRRAAAQARARRRSAARERRRRTEADARERRREARRSDRSRDSGGGPAIPKNCSGVDGPIPTPPGDPTGLDRDDDGQACE